ncbi:DNA polymerase theta-like isoform X2 [Mytilus galloprovincialis]|uniref:DNA polymerase theta-like isoform X2 n=1 Tax=Mytilus galloprovincialis TaxID=29158 RepID=UPI003F7C97CB
MATGHIQTSRRRLGRIPVTTTAQRKNKCLNPNSTVENTDGNQNKELATNMKSNQNKDMMASFSSSFCTDLDVEMLDVMDKMEENFIVKKTDTPKSRKCQLQIQTTKSPANPTNKTSAFVTKKSAVHSTTKSITSSSGTNLINNASEKSTVNSAKTSADILKPQSAMADSTRFLRSKHLTGSKIITVMKSYPTTPIGTNTSITNNEVFKSPGDFISTDRKICNQSTKKSVHHLKNDDNISWQTPKIASTPQTTPNSRKGLKLTASDAKRQNHLLKSLFTLETSMNISDIILSPCLESTKKSEVQQKKLLKQTSSVKENDKENAVSKCKTSLLEMVTNSHQADINIDGGVARQQPTKDQNHQNNQKDRIEKNLKRKSDLHEKSSILNISGDKLSLSNWGLSEPVLNQYHSKGITAMFEWQAECLCKGNTLAGGNLVYSAPTSAGKTMVAELLVLKRVMETKKKAIFILPFVSVAREKMFYLQQLYQDAGIRVSGFMGSYSPPGGLKSVDVAVCTIEKGNGLINRLLEHKELDKLGIIVVDELHLVGDSHRGYLLELMLTKICYVMRKEMEQLNKGNQSTDVVNGVQIVGMSATLPNLDLLARWLKAELYHTDYRPVPLTECVKIGTTLYDSSLVKIRDIDLTLTFKDDSDHVIPLCLETLKGGHSVLIFCPTKNWCEKLSESVAKEFYMILRNSKPQNGEKEELPLPLNGNSLMDVVEQLKRTPVGLDSTLGRTVPFGVAYHHAGLTFDERDIIEGSFRQGIIKVLIATSTLSSGVNLPARRVIVRSPTFHAGKIIDILTYKQMIGRAGRKGVDTEGESILICRPNERDKAVTLISSSLPPVQSCLVSREGQELSSSLKRAILEIVVSGVATVPADVALYTSCTMLSAAISADDNGNEDMIAACIKFLQENEFVCLQKVAVADGKEEERFCPTQLGSAVLASSLSPREGLVVFAELQKARQCFVLENELHIIYLVTPIYSMDFGSSLDWYQYYCLWESLSVGMKRVAELVGVQESFIARAIRGRILTKTEAQMRSLAIHRRFYTSLILHDLVHEVPLPEVARKYNCNKGQLQSLQQSAATFAGMVTVFCARLGWHNLELILSQFQNRLTFGIQRELCDLVRLTLLNGQRARVLYNAGYHTVTALANATEVDVELVLKNAAPFQSKKQHENETEYEAAQRQSSRCIWLTGRKGVTELEAAEAIISEAKSIIQEELGGLGIQWKNDQDSVNKTQGQNSRSSVLVTPNNSHNSLTQKKTSSNSFHRRKTSKGRRRSSTGLKRQSLKSANSSIANNELNGQTVVKPPVLEKQDTGSKLKLTCLNLNETDEMLTMKKPDTVVSNTNNDEASKTESCRPCQIVPKNVDVEIENVSKNVVTIQADVHHEVGKGEEKMQVDLDCNLTNDFEDFSQISFTIGKHCTDVENIDNNINDQNFLQTERFENPSNDITEKRNGQPVVENIKLNIESELHGEFSDAPVDSVSDKRKIDEVQESEDLFIGLTQEFEVSCQPFDQQQQTNENTLDKHSSNLDLKHLCNLDRKSTSNQKIHVNNENGNFIELKRDENTDNSHDEFEDSFCVDTQVAMELSHHENNSKSILGYTEDKKEGNIIRNGNNTKAKSLDEKGLQRNCNNELNLSDDQIVVKTKDKVTPTVDCDIIEISPVSEPPCKTAMSVLRAATQDASPMIADIEKDDLLDRSEVLIAASNFERCMYVNSEDIFEESGQIPQNESYQDLHIPFQSGQERIFEENEKQLPNVVSQYHNLQEDLAVAMEMGDTFSSTFLGNDNNKNQQLLATQNNELSDSLTLSMVEKVLNDESPVHKVGSKNKDENRIIRNSEKMADDSKTVKEKKTNRKPMKSKLSPGTLAFLDSMNSFSVATEISSEGDKNENQNDKKLKSKNIKTSKPVASLSNSKNGRKFCSNGNTSVENDLLPPTPPEKNASFMSPHLTPNKLKLTARKGKIGNMSARSVLQEENTTASKKAKTADVASDFERIKHQISQVDDEDDISDSEKDIDYTERTFDFEPDLSGITSTQSALTVIDVCADTRLFDTFRKEWSTKMKYSVSLACERKKPDLPKGGGIGGKFIRGKEKECQDDSLAPAPSDESITTEVKLKVIQSVMEKAMYRGKVKSLMMFDSKSQYTTLVRGCGLIPAGKIQDPKIAYWLLDPGAKEKNLHGMVHNYLPTEGGLLEGIGGGIGYGSIGLTPENPGSGRFRATTESVLTLHVMDYFLNVLQKEELLTTFLDVEMPSIVTLARMELNGFGYSENECESQMNIMLARLSSLEDQAYQLAGHPFSLTATDDIAQVLFIELQLPPDGDPSNVGQLRGNKRAVGQRKGRGRGTLSTSKEVLEKLKPLHPLPSVILEWRRISSALTKVVYQLQKVKVHNTRADMYRIFCETQFHTATGRVSMTEPNLQNIPKDFKINLPDVIGESPTPEKGPPTGRKIKGKLNQMKSASKSTARVENVNRNSSYSVSMRHAFVPFKGGILVAADYSQLELRMIAHLSNDQKLIRILNEDGDVFKLITAQWKGISPEEVTAVERQQAKQVCYGMIYGIGAKALGQQLEVDENDAAVFIETFKAKYPSMRTYLRTTVEYCRDKGYVQTMTGRRRYLPSITSTQPYSRAHAERQAVNTTVQGSAADLVKTAMNCIDVKLKEVFPQSAYTHSHKFIERRNVRSRSKSTTMKLSGGYLVLQLHDELIYEVCQDDMIPVAQIIQSEMENAMKLSVRLPVKVKAGPSWGKLEEINL